MQLPRPAPTIRLFVGVALIAAFLSPALAYADSVIQIALSVKRIASPFSGSGPSNYHPPGIESLNTLMEAYGRGYTFVLVDNGALVGGVDGWSRPSPSAYYFTNIASQSAELVNLEHDALADPNRFAWSAQAVNIFVNEGTQDHVCVFANNVQAVVIGGSDSHLGSMYLHELGHYFGLCNTQGCTCLCCSTGGGDCSEPQSDGIADTLPDKSCWDQDESAMFNFGTPYANLNPAQQSFVDAAIRNVMSFRGASCALGPWFRPLDFTEGQLDRWADVASTSRLAACDGRTFFVQAGAGGTQTGRSTAPFDRVAEGVGAANGGGDIVMIRGGTYAEAITISSPVTLRVPRNQVARIGG